MHIRTSEVLNLIDTMKTLTLPIDMSRLVMSGHSFGAMTAIEVARMSKEIKCVIPLDPYFLHR